MMWLPVGFGGLYTHAQQLSNLLRRLAFGNQLQDLSLTRVSGSAGGLLMVK